MHKKTAIGNELIDILTHSLIIKDGIGKGVTIRIKNIAGVDIGKAVLSVSFYDINGNIIDEIKSILENVEKDQSRTLRTEPSKATEIDVKGYQILIEKVNTTPLPIATGNDLIMIMNHHLIEDVNPHTGGPISSIYIAIRNVSDKIIATVVFDIICYDAEGNVLATFQHKEYELKPNTSRGMDIDTTSIGSGIIKSYKVELISYTTTDIECVRLIKKEIAKISNGEEISGIVKNISDVKKNVAIVATFKDPRSEIIGINVLPIKDISPNECRQFRFIFRPQKGDLVKTCSLNIGDIVTEDELIDPTTGAGSTQLRCC